MDKIRWGIIGTGRIAHTFAESLAGTADAELYAAASRDRAKALDFAERYGFCLTGINRNSCWYSEIR